MNQSGKTHLQVETRLISGYGVSDPGQQRSHNEDAIFINDQGNFFLLADGMGGQRNGAQASSFVIESVARQLRPEIIDKQLEDITESDGVPTEVSGLCSVVENAVSQANHLLYQTNCRESESKYGFMGTTIAGIYLASCGYIISFHIGDSRTYRFRGGQLTQMTKDHSLYQEWFDHGQTGKQPRKNILTQAIGFNEYVQPDIHCSRYFKNDLYLLCSDGLTNMLPDRRIEEILTQGFNVGACADILLGEANDAGGLDNISVILCHIVS